MWLSAAGWCHTVDCQVKLDLLESRTPYVLRCVLKCEHEPEVQTQTFFGLSVFNCSHNVISAPWAKPAALAACSGAWLLSNQVVSQNLGHADCFFFGWKPEITLMQLYVFAQKMHGLLDTAVSKTSGVILCSHSKPLSASSEVISIWDCHWAYLNAFGFLLLFSACALGHPLFFFYNPHSVYFLSLLHDDAQPNLSSSQSFLVWIHICLFRG